MACEYRPARLLALKEESGLSLAAIKEATGIDRGDLSRYFNGHATPGADRLAKILGAMGKSWKDLDEPRPRKVRKS